MTKEKVMNHTIRAPIVLLCLAALSSTAIMCSSTGDYTTAANTVELRKVQRVKSVLTAALDNAIWQQASGLQAGEWDICPPNMDVGKMIDHRITRWTENDVHPEKYTIDQLEQIRNLISLRADEAFSRGNAAALQDFQASNIDSRGFSGKIAAPANVQ
jgi:hypothetical protein